MSEEVIGRGTAGYRGSDFHGDGVCSENERNLDVGE